MGIIDGTVLGLLIVSALWGFIRGGKKKATKLVAFVGALTLSIVFYSMLGNLIAQSSMGRSLAENYAKVIIEKADSLQLKALLILPYKMFSLKEITYAFKGVGIPGFFVAFFVGKICFVDGSVALAIGSSFAAATIYAICFVSIFIVSYIVLKLLTKALLSGGKQKESKGPVNRLAGSFLSMFKVSILILIAMMILIGVGSAYPDLKSWLEEDIGFNKGYVSIGGVYYRIAWSIIYSFILPNLENKSHAIATLTALSISRPA